MSQHRILWWVSALLVASALLLAGTGVPVARGQSATPAAVTAPAPDWRFVVHAMQDPYAGVLTTPAQPAPGMRSVGVEVEVVNGSVQPLTFDATSISLRDDTGFSYRGGTAVGSEPALPGRTMPGGERARGWVWFAVPEGATLREIVFVPSAPELRVGLDAVATIPGSPGSATTATVVVTSAPAVTASQPTPPTVTPLPTEVPAAAVTTTEPPGATVAPTSVIIIEGAETPEGAVASTSTPAATSTPAPVATAIPLATSTAAIVPSAPTATAPAAAAGIEEGSSVITGESDANLRGGPSLDAAIVGTIPLGSELAVTGPAVAGDDLIWWPVIVVATGEEGYVAEDLLTPLDE